MPATYFHTKRRLLWRGGRLQGGKAPEKKGEGHPCIEMGEAKIPPGMKNEAGPHVFAGPCADAHECCGQPPGGLQGGG